MGGLTSLIIIDMLYKYLGYIFKASIAILIIITLINANRLLKKQLKK